MTTRMVFGCLAAAALVVAVGLLLGWADLQGTGPSLAVAAAPAETPQPEPLRPAALVRTFEIAAPPRPIIPIEHPSVPAPAPETSTNWNEAINDILSSGADNSAKSAALLNLFPHLPVDEQVQAVQHLSNLLPDQDYPALGQYLTNASTPEPVLDALMAGLLSRPKELSLPWLLIVARQQQNPKADDARLFLSVLMQPNYGDQWHGRTP